MNKPTLGRRASEMIRRTLCGIITSSKTDCILNPDDIIIVNLCDVTLGEWTRFDFPHIPQEHIVASTKLDDCNCFPIPFTIYYNDEQIDKNLCYGIRCDIVNKSNEVKYTSERFVPVLTEKYPKTNVYITVEPQQNSSKLIEDNN